MRITTYEKGGNSLNPFIKSSIFLIIILCLFVIPVSALNENFNDRYILDWDIISGTWTTSNSTSIEGSEDYYLRSSLGTTTSEITFTTADAGDTYIEFNFRENTASNKNADMYFDFSVNGTDQNGLYLHIRGSTVLKSNGFTMPDVSLNALEWYKATITISYNNIEISIYDSNANLVITQTTTFNPIISPSKIRVKHVGYIATSEFNIDNIFTSDVPPSTVTNIKWVESSYTVGDTGVYDWVITSDLWYSFLYKYRTVLEKEGNILETAAVSQTASGYYDFEDAGAYTIKLQASKIIFTNWGTIDSDATSVIPHADSYINVPQTAPQRTNFTVNYLYGSTPSNGLILMKRLDETTGIYETIEFDLLGADKQGGISYSRNMSLHSTGTYKITLIHDEQVDEIYDVIEITSLYVPPIETVGNSSISSDKSIYAIGETIFAQYAVDYTNFTTYNVNMEIYNIDKDIISYSVPTIDQISYISQTIPITNEYFAGSHSLRLTSYDNTGAKVAVLVNKNITIGLVNDGGFGLSLSKYDVMQLELFVIKAISPTTANIRVWSVERDVQVGGLITINGSTYLNYAIPRIGNYEITLSSGGFEITKQYITVHEGFVDDGDKIDDEVIPDTSFQDNTTNLLNSPYLIGLFIMCVFLAIGATNGIGGTIVTGSIGLGIVCYMGIFPWILLVIEVLVVAVLMAKGIINLSGD